MKTSITMLFMLFWNLTLNAHATSEMKNEMAIITDREALEMGMTLEADYIEAQKNRQREWETLEKDPTGKTVPDELKAEVVVIVNKAPKGTSPTAQRAMVYHNGQLLRTIEVSTGKETRVTSTSGKVYIATTPLGYFRPTTIWKEYQSATWVGATMNFPIFFINGIALHATTPDHYAELGTRDSGGCVRMHPDNAQWLNELVLETGAQNYELKPQILWVNKKKIQRTRVMGGELDVASVARSTGIYSTKTVKSWDTLIVVRDIRTP